MMLAKAPDEIQVSLQEKPCRYIGEAGSLHLTDPAEAEVTLNSICKP